MKAWTVSTSSWRASRFIVRRDPASHRLIDYNESVVGPEIYRKDPRTVCRNIKPLFNFEPAVTNEEIHAASLQFVRKISGFSKPSRANEAAFNAAVDEIAAVAVRLLNSLESNSPPKDREEEAATAKARSIQRFGV
jgi:hypothetical protein